MIQSNFYLVLRKKVMLWLFHKCFSLPFRIFLLGKSVWYFHGLRRSGNHACIYWIANAINNKKIEIKTTHHYLFNFLGPEILHINSFAQENPVAMALATWKLRRQIKNVKTIFLSLEDDHYKCVHFMNPYKYANYQIGITRNISNILSSRLKAITRDKARADGGWPQNFVITDQLFLIHSEICEQQRLWKYDKFITDSEWRREFLDCLGLHSDIPPQRSTEGGGSSYQTKTKTTELDRFEEATIPEHTLRLINKHMQNLPTLSQQQLETWISRQL